MNRNTLRLNTIVRATLREARLMRARRSASSIALLALSGACAWSPSAFAEEYFVSNATELQSAISAANANTTDSAATITLTASFTAASVPAPSKPITVNTQGFTLSGVSLSGAGSVLTFAGAVAGASAAPTANATGLNGLDGNFDAKVLNLGSIKGGAGGGLGGAGGYGAKLINRASVTNAGTITGGLGIAGGGGQGSQVTSSASLINNAGGVIQGGDGLTGGAGVDIGNPSGSNSLTNYGVIRGGAGLTGSGGVGLRVRAGTLPIVNTGTIEGANGAYAIESTGTIANFTLTNSGIIRAGAGQAVAIQMTANTTTSLLELRSGSAIEGKVVASAASSNDTLRLGGDVDAVFASDVGAGAQFQNFDRFEKTGASTWTLTGTSTIASPWNIAAGTLQLGNGGTSGSIIGNVTNNGALTFNRSDTLTFGGLISGTGSVSQIGTGTTVLSGGNTYSGGTTINAGVLQVSSDSNLGVSGGDLSFSGGSLRATADMSLSRTVILLGNGGFITDPGKTLALTGVVSGAGSLNKAGAGTLVLASDTSYTGGTSISAGILQLGNGATSGSIGGDVLNNGTLAFNRGDTVTFGGAISGTGSVSQMGSGTTILTAENSYSGGTTISAGTVQVGDGGTRGSIGTGDVLNDGALIFNRSNTLAVAGAISGTGSVKQIGSGTTLLTGDNTYTGGTTISAGTLQLGNGGTSGSLTGDVANAGTFAFNRSDALAYDGIIGGNGIVRQIGAGTTTLSAAGSNASTLDVQAGTLKLASGASLSASKMSVAAGATLGSAGALTGTTGNDTFALAGTFIGSASLLDGDDRVQIADGADFSQAAFDGGAGVDTLDLTSGTALTLGSTLATHFENLTKRGSGALTLAGTVDGYSDSITIAGGTVRLVSADILTQQMNIESGVTLTGTGSLSGNLLNAGALSPGNSPGTIQVGGNYTQTATGALISQIERTGTDLLDIAGTARLAGAHQIQIEYGLYLDGTTQTLIRAAGGISGQFDTVTMNPSALMTASRLLSANQETVSFALQPITSVTDPRTGRGRFAAWLDEQISGEELTPEMTHYIDSLLQEPTAAGAAALLSERSEPVASIAQNSVAILGARFARGVFERSTSGDEAQCAPAQEKSSDTLNCFWAHGLRQWGHARGETHYDWMSDGGQFGVDRALPSGWAVGATFGYADSDTHDLNGGRNDARSKMGGLYANYASDGRLTVGALTFYGDNENDTRRNVQVDGITQRARANFDSNSYGAGVRVGYRASGDAGPLVRPFVEAFYDHIKGTELSESGAGDGSLSGRLHGRDGLRGTLGLQLADDFAAYGRVFRPALEMGVVHQFADVRSTLDLQPFSDASAFRTYGPALDRTAYVARASLDVSLGTNASVALGYGGELSDDYSQHEANLSFHIVW